jgi:beta-lactamase regulating signal transducer with metallopeptidase domain
MTLPPNLHWLAAVAFERMLYCLAEGTALAIVVAVALRLVPQKNSQTRFAVWFATLVAVVVLPVLQMGTGFGAAGQSRIAGLDSRRALLTISTSWAEYILLGWAALAGAGLLRVAAGVWQVRGLRRGCAELDSRSLSAELQAVVAESRKRRPVSILVSPTLDVPTAIGFLRPAILIPAWLAESDAAAELKHVLLHELAHLRRWDDWTNLAQKLAKAVLFFHPGVWWIERKLSLDREMACDDDVLAKTSNPRIYAECLARVAERSFLRRQMALAQAAVSRMKQLSVRVTWILAEDRPRSTRLWKPAVPMVMVAAGLCAVSTSTTPDLVRLTDDQPLVTASPVASDSRQPTVTSSGADPVFSRSAPASADLAKFTPASMNAQAAREWQTSLKSRLGQGASSPRRRSVEKRSSVISLAQNTKPADQSPVVGSNLPAESVRAVLASESNSALESRQDGVPEQNVVLLVVTSQRITSFGFETWTWQVSTWEVRAIAPTNHPTKQIPRKT